MLPIWMFEETSRPQTAAKKRFLLLDLLRGLAALVVVLSHMDGVTSQIFSSGYLAVDFFFVLSGFVLAQAYGEQRLDMASFLKIRLIRLYPLYIVGTIFGVLVIAQLRSDPRTYLPLIFNIFFLPSPDAGPNGNSGFAALFPFNMPAWSLFFELAVNIVWFAMLPLLTTRRLVVLCICAAIFRIVGHLTSGAFGMHDFWSALWTGTSRTPYCFFVGVAIFRVWRSGVFPIKAPIWLIVVLSLTIFALPPYPLLHALEILLLLPALVLLAANIDPPKALVSACALLGSLSYAIYAIHYPILVAFNYAATGLAWPSGWQYIMAFGQHEWGLAPLEVLTVLGLGFLLDRYFDTPLRRRLARRVQSQMT